MEKISMEGVISSLFILGFNQVDPFLYTLVVDRLIEDGEQNGFLYVDEPFSEEFSMAIDCNGVLLKPKRNQKLNSDLLDKEYLMEQFFFEKIGNGCGFEQVNENNSCVDINKYSLEKLLNVVNSEFVSYLKTFDFKKIVMQKVMMIGLENIDDYLNLFSNKEIEIIGELVNMHMFNETDKENYSYVHFCKSLKK